MANGLKFGLVCRDSTGDETTVIGMPIAPDRLKADTPAGMYETAVCRSLAPVNEEQHSAARRGECSNACRAAQNVCYRLRRHDRRRVEIRSLGRRFRRAGSAMSRNMAKTNEKSPRKNREPINVRTTNVAPAAGTSSRAVS